MWTVRIIMDTAKCEPLPLLPKFESLNRKNVLPKLSEPKRSKRSNVKQTGEIDVDGERTAQADNRIYLPTPKEIAAECAKIKAARQKERDLEK